ncbi:MAG: ATP-binding protein [Bacteroidaceae bacterium]|nr:ATP-binding protein [Bacteroidaceae bacterium]
MNTHTATAPARNSFIVSKALTTFVMAAVLTSAANQLAHTADSMIVGHIVNTDAVSAINLVLPIVEVLNCFGFLIAFGANALCAQAIGSDDKERVAKIFSSTIIAVMTLGLAVSLGLSFFSMDIVEKMSDEPRLNPMAFSYIHVYAMGAWLQMMSYGLSLMVATDGQPRIVTKSVIAGAITNIIVDILTIYVLGMGVEGAALGSLSMFTVNIIILVQYIRKPESSYKFKWPGKDFFSIFVQNMKQGAPITLSNSLMAVTILLLNHIVLTYLGADGLFLWSVCLQMLLLSYVFIDGLIESLFAIGGILVGERDVKGLQILVKKALIIIGSLVTIVIVLMYIPGLIGFLFGVTEPTLSMELNRVLQIFALMLIPFSVTQILLSTYQLLGHEKTSVITATAQTVFMVITVWITAEVEGIELWWGFAVGCIMVLVLQICNSFIQSRLQHNTISSITMIPNDLGGHTFDRSVNYDEKEVGLVLNEIDKFLKESGVDKQSLFEVNLCCEELMTNIARHSVGSILKHTFDVHIYINDEGIFVTLKDAGKPFDPIKAGKMADKNIGSKEHPYLGLRLVTNIIPDISYKYMYGENTVLICRKND